jgi:hypothetical protein
MLSAAARNHVRGPSNYEDLTLAVVKINFERDIAIVSTMAIALEKIMA